MIRARSQKRKAAAKDGSTLGSEFAYYVLRTLNRTVPAYRTSSVQFLKRNVPYPYHYKKGVLYQRTLLLSKNWGVPYRTYVPYRTAIHAFSYSQL